MALYRRALDEGITFAPGHMFSAADCYRNYIRITCGYQWENGLGQRLARLGELAKTSR